MGVHFYATAVAVLPFNPGVPSPPHDAAAAPPGSAAFSLIFPPIENT